MVGSVERCDIFGASLFAWWGSIVVKSCECAHSVCPWCIWAYRSAERAETLASEHGDVKWTALVLLAILAPSYSPGEHQIKRLPGFACQSTLLSLPLLLPFYGYRNILKLNKTFNLQTPRYNYSSCLLYLRTEYYKTKSIQKTGIKKCQERGLNTRMRFASSQEQLAVPEPGGNG